jgi:hypothetical protein
MAALLQDISAPRRSRKRTANNNKSTSLKRRLKLNGSPAEGKFQPCVGMTLQLPKNVVSYFVVVR